METNHIKLTKRYLRYISKHLTGGVDIAFRCALNLNNIYFFSMKFRGQTVVKHGGHQGISFLLIDFTGLNL